MRARKEHELESGNIRRVSGRRDSIKCRRGQERRRECKVFPSDSGVTYMAGTEKRRDTSLEMERDLGCTSYTISAAEGRVLVCWRWGGVEGGGDGGRRASRVCLRNGISHFMFYAIDQLALAPLSYVPGIK
jgi:hypothetical protein